MAKAAQLDRKVAREIPRLVTIYDLPHTPKQIRAGVAARFRHFAAVKDERVVDMLLSKGEMELEESLMQWKQKTHVARLVESFCVPESVSGTVSWQDQGRDFLENFHFGASSSSAGSTQQELLFSTFWSRV